MGLLVSCCHPLALESSSMGGVGGLTPVETVGGSGSASGASLGGVGGPSPVIGLCKLRSWLIRFFPPEELVAFPMTGKIRSLSGSMDDDFTAER